MNYHILATQDIFKSDLLYIYMFPGKTFIPYFGITQPPGATMSSFAYL